jgi:hypothetical protein
MQEQETPGDFPDPWEGDTAGIQEAERSRESAWRLLHRRASLRAADLRTARRRRRQRSMMYAPLVGCPPLGIPWLRAIGSHRRTVNEEGAHAKRPVSR